MYSSFKENLPGPSVEKVSPPQISSELLLSWATAPLVLGILASRGAAEFMSGLGESSEEIFRGDRLPMLNFPKSQQQV